MCAGLWNVFNKMEDKKMTKSCQFDSRSQKESRFLSKKLYLKYILNSLTLSRLGGGTFCPDHRRSSVVSTWIVLRSPNFLTLFFSMLDTSQAQKKILKNSKISHVAKGGTLLKTESGQKVPPPSLQRHSRAQPR